MDIIIYSIAIVFLVALVFTMKKSSQKETAGYIQSQGEKEALKQAERMRAEINGFNIKTKKENNYLDYLMIKDGKI